MKAERRWLELQRKQAADMLKQAPANDQYYVGKLQVIDSILSFADGTFNWLDPETKQVIPLFQDLR